ncbi:phosphopantetheine-binding protein, partial [Kibdelosporangium lantanae]
EIEVDRRFSEQGLDSVAGTDLQARLTAATGLRMERKVVFQYDTPLALAEHLMTLTDTADTSPAKPVDGADGLGHLYRQMMGQGRNDLAMDLLRVASKLRNTFDRSATADRSGVVTLATGSDDPVLVCVPSFAAMSGEYHYTRLAKHLRGNRSTTVSLHPGFGTDNAVPVDLATLVDGTVSLGTEVNILPAAFTLNGVQCGTA